MKKQILTLTMCLALTATAALADGTKAVTQKATPQAKVSVPANVQAKVSTTTAKPQVKPAAGPEFSRPGEPPSFASREEAKKHFDKERGLLYSALNLSTEQIAKAEALDAQTRAEAGKYIRKVHMEAKKLRDLKAKHASIFAIYKQKFVLKTAKVDADSYFAASKKAFEAILTKEQKAKFKLIDDAKKKEMAKLKKEHRHGHGGHKGMGPKSHKGAGPEHMGPPPEGTVGPEGSQGKGPVGPPPPPPEDKK